MMDNFLGCIQVVCLFVVLIILLGALLHAGWNMVT